MLAYATNKQIEVLKYRMGKKNRSDMYSFFYLKNLLQYSYTDFFIKM